MERKSFIKVLADYEEEIRSLHPQDPSQWTANDLGPQSHIREPPYGVWQASKSLYGALSGCKSCTCMPVHEFGALLCLGTYRIPARDVNVTDDVSIDFNMFLSMEQRQEWHDACVHYTKERVAHFAINDGPVKTSTHEKNLKTLAMKVQRLCEPIKKVQSMGPYRMEFKLSRGQLFKLPSKRIIPHSGAEKNLGKDLISLEQFLESGPRSFTERTRRILAVLLSFTVLHFHDTPWLQSTRGSADILFFRTASKGIPLKPYIRSPLSFQDGGDRDEEVTANVETDDIDPDDLIQHQCPTLITLAVMLMEVYFASPLDVLADTYHVTLGCDVESRHRTRYDDTDLLFKACREDIPENSRFNYAIEKCLDPTVWEDDEGKGLDALTLRTRIYEEVVRPLETELLQGWNSISIDDLDQYAETLNFASWDQVIQRSDRPYEAKGSRALLQSTEQPKESISRQAYQGHRSISIHQPKTKIAPLTTDYQALKFFDDETISEAHTNDACLGYTIWKSRYHAVYEKYIVAQPLISPSKPVKIAVLDTGVDLTHPDMEARMQNIKGKYNWHNENLKHAVHDRNGHGTFVAGLLLDYASDAELYIAKISEHEPASPKAIANAINYAVSTWNVDIISMSFGFPSRAIEDYSELDRALKNAYAKQVLLFAAASNSGGKLGRSFPARETIVIAVHATDASGNRSRFSPTAVDDDISLATVGEAVESAWPVILCDEKANPTYIKHKSGTSYATPIAAGIAAFLLHYARINLPENATALKSHDRMKALLRKVSKKVDSSQLRDGYHFLDLSLYSDSLFGKGKEYVDLTIREIINN